jgi:tetratricopeptide (TPR) repeat protein
VFLLRVFLVVLSLAVPAALLRPVLSDHYSGNVADLTEDKLLRAAMVTGEDARYHYLLGLLHYNSPQRRNYEQAIRSYTDALERNPTDARAWVALAKAYQDSGIKDKALFALRRVLASDRSNPIFAWESGVHYLLADRLPDAMASFRKFLSMSPGDQESVYSLCYVMGVDSRYVLDNLLPENYPSYSRYLGFLAATGLLEESRDLWKRMRKWNPQKAEYLKYIEFLIGQGAIKDGISEWGDFVKRFGIAGDTYAFTMPWNGDFEYPIVNGGFDWRIGRAEGVRIFRDKDVYFNGFASLSVSFDGTTNPGISIAEQFVPVEPGRRYKLSGYVKTEKLTTQNGILLEVSPHRCDPLVQKTEPLTGTNRWKKVELEFRTPKSCSTVRVSIKREQSQKFDNKISGDAWIDSLTITPEG